MEEEEEHIKDEISDPDRDFGLPKVDIHPIQNAGEVPESAQVPMKPIVATGDKHPVAVKTTGSRGNVSEKNGPVQESEKEGNNYKWLIIILVLLGLFVGAWYYYSNNREQMTRQETAIKDEMEKPSSTAVPPPKVEVPEEPAEVVPTLTEIASRANGPRYFVVVGSFIDEDLAKDYSQGLLQKGISTFLVYPYGEIPYYRLAIGQFESFGLAAQEVDQVKSNYKENLWVLKY